MSLDDFFARDPKLVWEEIVAEREREEKERKRRELEEWIAGKKGGRKPGRKPLPPGPPLPRGPFAIEDLPDRWRLHGVSYGDDLCAVDWGKELLDGGNRRTQEDWVGLTKDSEWKLASAPLYHASLALLYHNRNLSGAEQKGLVGKMKSVFANDFRLYWMMTCSRVAYKPRGDDVVTHGFGYGNPRTVQKNIAGPCNYVTAGCGFEGEIDALLGTRDLVEVEQVYKWVSGKKPYLWQLNDKPRVVVERAVVLGGDGDWFDIDADDDINEHRPARGVVMTQAQKISSGNEG